MPLFPIVAGERPDSEGLPPVGPRFELKHSLWRHPLGRVFAAHDRANEQPVVLTVLHGSMGESEEALKVCRANARVAAGLPSAYIIETVDVVRGGDGRLVVATDYHEAASLGGVARSKALATNRTVGIIRQVCKGLGEAHAVGILHGALTTGSILLTIRDGQPDVVLLTDFGLGDLVHSDLARVSEDPNSLPHSPEKVMGLNRDHREDIYLLGCIAYTMLTGGAPFRTGDTEAVRRRHAIEDVMPINERLAKNPIPEPIAAVIHRCLAKEPDERYPNMAELEAALCEAQIEAGVASAFDDLPLPAIDSSRREAILKGLAPGAIRASSARAASKAAHTRPTKKPVDKPASGDKVASTKEPAANDPSTHETAANDPATAAPPANDAAEAANDPAPAIVDKPPSASMSGHLNRPGKTTPTAVIKGVARRKAEEEAAAAAKAKAEAEDAAEAAAAGFSTPPPDFEGDHDDGSSAPIHPGSAPSSAPREPSASGPTAAELSAAAAAVPSGLGGGAASFPSSASMSAGSMAAMVPKKPWGLYVAVILGLGALGAGAVWFSQQGSGPDPAPAETKSTPTTQPPTEASGANVDDLVSEAKSALLAGNNADGEALLDKAIAIDKTHGDALRALSRLHFDRRDYHRAIQFGKRAVASEPKNPEGRILLGDAFLELGNFGDAKVEYAAAKELGHAEAEERLDELEAKAGG